MTTDIKIPFKVKVKQAKIILGMENENDAYHNLLGAIYDIEQSEAADDVSMNTLRRVADQLRRLQKLLGAPL